MTLILASSTTASETPLIGEAADPGHGDWVVLHPLDIARHQSRMQGEIDFLVIARGLGVLVLEVKGWHSYRYDEGLWSHDGPQDPDRRGPFKQADEAKFSLIRRLKQERPHLRGDLVKYAVCSPNVAGRLDGGCWTVRALPREQERRLRP
jgi:hypothetical protein